MKQSPAKRSSGFTMAELLLVVALIGILFTVTMVNWRNQVMRSRDSMRKADLGRVKIAFEEYYTDYGCYPPYDVLEDCGSDALSPYLREVPCDPDTGEPYEYRPETANCPTYYRVFALLKNTSDPDIERVGCFLNSCWGYNWGISMGVPVGILGSGANNTPTPWDSPPTCGSGTWACAPDAVCRSYPDPEAYSCPVTFEDTVECTEYCVSFCANSDESERCLP